MKLSEQVKEQIEAYLVAKNLTDDNPYRIEFICTEQNDNSCFHIRRKKSGRNLAVDINNNIITIDLEYAISYSTYDLLTKEFPNFQSIKKYEHKSFINEDKYSNPQVNLVHEFSLRSAVEVKRFFEIIDEYI